MGHASFIRGALTLASTTTFVSWIFLFNTVVDIQTFQRNAEGIMVEFKESADKAWSEMVGETQGMSILEITSVRAKRFIRRNKSGSKVLIVRRRQVAASTDCVCCPDEQDQFGVNPRCPTGPPGLPGRPGIPGGIHYLVLKTIESLDPGLNGEDGKVGYDGASFVMQTSFDCVLCPAGPRGPQGISGPMGPKGPDGKPGNPGPPGLAGKPGLKGPPGGPGLPGKLGVPGNPGKKGSSGIRVINLPGRPGPIGGPGLQGQIGLPGKQGSPGLPGDVGPRGLPGRPGATGPLGDPGKPGYEGNPGPDATYCPCPERSASIQGGDVQPYPEYTDYKRWRRYYSKKTRRT